MTDETRNTTKRTTLETMANIYDETSFPFVKNLEIFRSPFFSLSFSVSRRYKFSDTTL